MMFELKKLITAMILPPFNILILWGTFTYSS